MAAPPPGLAQQRGIHHLNHGQPLQARQAFEHALVDVPADVLAHLGLAYACAALHDAAAALAAVNAALALDSRNLRALLLKGELVLKGGDERSAAAFFNAALNSAPPLADLPIDLQQSLQRAQAALQGLGRSFETSLRRYLAESASSHCATSSRFDHALDLLVGKRELYRQQPRLFCFPELPHIQFFDRALFPWLDAVEAATESIREELLAVMNQPQAEGEAFKPYVASDPTRPALNPGGMLDNPDWSAFFLWKNGEAVEVNAARCPRTMRALAHAPIPHIAGRSPSILFSRLQPGAHIPAHNGFVNTRLICHLPLVVPPGCRFRVGNEVREWRVGQAWVFDDTIEHEAWNNSDQTRVVLLFEIWRPELTVDERALVSSLFEAIGQHQGSSGEWGI